MGGVIIIISSQMLTNPNKKESQKNYFAGFFLLGFGLSQLASLQFILYHVAGFYKPTIPQSPPSHLQDYSI
jgi:hypothetical protein